MRSLRTSILGTVVGMVVGIMSIVIAYAGLSFSGERNVILPAAIIVSALLGSSVAGAICVALRCLVTRREQSVVAPLLTVAIASLVVLPGNYVNGSPIPPMMYGMALLNGLIVARAISPLCTPGGRSRNRTLS